MLLAFVPATLFAQNRKQIIEVSKLPTNYSVTTMRVGTDGTKSVKVSGFGSNDDAAVFNAVRNSVHAAIFKGFPASSTAKATPPICTDPNAMTIYSSYFNQFFAGTYLQYVNNKTDGVPSGADRVKVKGGYNVTIFAQVMYDNLRRRLEADGIVQPLKEINVGKKPTIMVVPSDIWCSRNGYVIEYENQGVKYTIPDYARAMSENSDIRVLVSALGNFMAAEGYPTPSMEQEIKKINADNLELSMLSGKNTGAAIAEDPVEMLRRQAKADIILDLDFERKKVGPRTQVTFNLQAIDAYTSKIISGNPGAGSNSSAAIEVLLEEAFLSFKDNMLKGMNDHFQGIQDNGREIVVMLRRFDGTPADFDTEFDYHGQMGSLADIIGVWFEENTVNGQFSEQDRSTNYLRYNQVFMPITGKSLSGKEVDIDATAFVRTLANMLKGDPYNLPVKTYQKGLGEVWLIIGDN